MKELTSCEKDLTMTGMISISLNGSDTEYEERT